MQDQRLEWLKTKMDDLFAKKIRFESEGRDFNSGIQNGREYRNPRICEKLIEAFDIKQYGTNLEPDVFNPKGWEKTEYYDSPTFRKMVERERERKSREHHHRHDNHHHHSKR